jgi:hypothetical protein
MTQRTSLTSLALLALCATTVAQNDEADFNQRQAKLLNTFAKKAFEKGFPRQARLIWLQTIKLYDADNQEAYTGIGYVKVGSSWNPDPAKPYPTNDTGTGADGQTLFKAYEALKKQLAGNHKSQAQKWAKAGRTDRANHHWREVLRWSEGDGDAQKALEHREVGSLTGSALEQTLFERSKKIERAVEEQSKTDYPVETVAGVECPPLDRAQISYVTVRSEHFTLHGDAAEEENLKESLVWAERTLRVCEVAFPWAIPKGERWGVHWAALTAKEAYQQVLRANQVPDLEWRLEHTSTCGIGNVAVGHMNGPKTLFDNAVRNVARRCANFGSDAFVEGIGHTFVGMMFNNNRLFSVDLKKQQGTSASEEDREYTSPDFDVWKNLNLELAWRSTGGVPARDLPFAEAASFSNEQRIKAWSFSDYLMRRDPELLRAFDTIAQDMKKARKKQPTEFEQLFAEGRDVTVAQLDKEWEDFWTGASPVLKAIQNNTPPLQAVSKGVDKWLEAFNAARKEWQATPAAWSANLSTRCKEHAEYLARNKDLKSPADIHTQSVELGGSYVGSMFAEMALVELGASVANAKKMFEKWVYLPGYRDALINNSILTVGMYVEGNILVVNAVSGLGAPKAAHAGYTYFPRKHDAIFEGSVPVADLGPDVQKLLAKHGRGEQKVVGFPVSVHFGTGIGADRNSFTCTMVGPKGERIEGALLFDDGTARPATAPGVVVFYPFDPLPKGQIGFAFSWRAGDTMAQAKGHFQAK